jgi:hypothetical protein
MNHQNRPLDRGDSCPPNPSTTKGGHECPGSGVKRKCFRLKRAGRALVFLALAFASVAFLPLHAATYAPGDIIRHPGGPEPHFVISWQAQPGKVYDILATPELGREWQVLNNAPITATSLVESFTDSSVQPSRFYTIRKRDTEPPAIESLLPREGAIAVRRQGTLTVDLADETAIDPNSIRFRIGAATAMTTADPRLSFSDNRLIYRPAETETLGGYGESVTVRFSVADTLGHELQNFEWSFQLELQTVLGAEFIPVGQAPGQQVQAANGPSLQLISIEDAEYRFRYSGDDHGILPGSILVSFDPATRFKIRALEIQDNPAEKIVALRKAACASVERT